jgi:hypothetical protein
MSNKVGLFVGCAARFEFWTNAANILIVKPREKRHLLDQDLVGG